MNLPKRNLSVIIEQSDLYNYISESFNNLKNHSDLVNVTFIHSDILTLLKKKSTDLKTKYVIFSSKSESILSWLEKNEHSTAVFANHLNYSKIYTNINNLGFQRQICDIGTIRSVEACSEFNYSLGLLSVSEELVSVELKTIHAAIIDLSVLSKNPFEFSFESTIFGLQIEKLIQFVTFCTKSPNFSTLIVNTSNLNFDRLDNTSELFATILWYLVEGLSYGHSVFKSDLPSQKLISTIKDLDQDLEFICQNKNYWARLCNEENSLTPCTFSEFEEGIIGEISPRLYKKFNK